MVAGSYSTSGHHARTFHTDMTVEDNRCASAEPLSMHTYEHLDAVGCPVVLACGGGGSPTDFIDRLMPAAFERLPDSRLHR